MKNKLFLIIISIIILSVTVLNFVIPLRHFSENENRVLAGPPSFSFQSLLKGEMSAQFESFVADQFFARDMWVSAKARLEKLTGKKENNGVYFAKDGYLIEVPKYDLDIVKSNISSINSFDGIKSTLLLIPTAYEVLNDKLPKFSYDSIQKEIISLVKKDVKSADVLCPINVLNENKDEYIYYKTDHHQTSFGSYLVYNELCKKQGLTPVKYIPEILSESFYGSTWSKATLPEIKPDTISTVKTDIKCTVTINDTITKNDIYDYEKLNTKDKYAVFLGGNYGKTVIETTAPSENSVLIIKDSYANGLLPYLINHYKKIVMIDLRYYNHDITELITQHNIDELIYIYNISTFGTDNNLKKIAK